MGKGGDDKWVFDDSVVEVFDDMLDRSIPNILSMREVVLRVGSSFLSSGGRMLDVGCSNGGSIKPFSDRFGDSVYYVGIDSSEPMIDSANSRFAGLHKNVTIKNLDVVTDMKKIKGGYNVVLCILTLMFVPLEQRQKVVAGLKSKIARGGAMIVVEKVLGHDADSNELLTKLYKAAKADNGYSKDEIEGKAERLKGVLVPLTAKSNVEMLEAEGFDVECIWRSLNFAGWLAVKK